MAGELHGVGVMRIALLAFLPACSLYVGDRSSPDEGADARAPNADAARASYELTPTRTMAGAHRIAGVDSDHAGGVWIAYQEVTSSDLEITHLDASGTAVSTWSFSGDPSEVSGIAVDDTAVWVNHDAIGSVGTDGITKLDVATGAELQTFATQGQISDLEIQWGELLLSSYQNQVIGIDRAHGGEMLTFETQVVPTTQTGIAAYGDGVFVSSWDMDTLTLVDRSGAILGTATSPVLHASETAAAGRFLANDGPGKLILASNDQIAWLDVLPEDGR